MTENYRQPIHATCIALKSDGEEWAGALLFGSSGSGKSDLALRLIHGLGPEACRLVADDYVHVTFEQGRIQAFAPAAIAGRMEVRGIGVVSVAALDQVPLIVAFDLVAQDEVPRIPDDQEIDLARYLANNTGPVSLPLYRVAAFDASACAKVVTAFALVISGTSGS